MHSDSRFDWGGMMGHSCLEVHWGMEGVVDGIAAWHRHVVDVHADVVRL